MKACIILSCLVVVCLSLPSRERNEGNMSKRTSVEIAEDTFNRVDITGDGFITAGEFANFAARNFPEYQNRIDFTIPEIETVFSTYLELVDQDSNGMVDFEEFLSINQ